MGQRTHLRMRIVRRQMGNELAPDETGGPAHHDGQWSHHGFDLPCGSATAEHVTYGEQSLAAERMACQRRGVPRLLQRLVKPAVFQVSI